MDRFTYENYEDFVCHLVELFESFNDADYDYKDFTIVAKYNDAKKILSELIKFDYPIERIEIEPEDLDGYDREYYISLSTEGIWCVKAFNVDSNKYFGDETYIVFVLDDCNSKIIKSIGCDLIYEVSIVDDEYFDDDEYCCDGDCENCEHYESDEDDYNDDVKGFTISGNEDGSYWSKSFYSSDMDLVEKMLELWS